MPTAAQYQQVVDWFTPMLAEEGDIADLDLDGDQVKTFLTALAILAGRSLLLAEIHGCDLNALELLELAASNAPVEPAEHLN